MGDFLISLILTALFYSGPICIYRFCVTAKPVKKGKALAITIIYGFAVLFIINMIAVSTGTSASGGGALLWSIVNYNMLKHGYIDENKSEVAEPTKKAPISKDKKFICTNPNCKLELTGWYKTCPQCGQIDTIVRKDSLPQIDETSTEEKSTDEEANKEKTVEELKIETKESECAAPEENSNFVEEGSNQTIPAPTEIKFCRNCGHKLAEGSIFCGNCGMEIIYPSSENVSETKDNGHNGQNVNIEENALFKLIYLGNLSPKLKRAFIYLEDEDWQEANEYADKALDEDPYNAFAYLAKAFADLKISDITNVNFSDAEMKANKNYRHALKFSEKNLESLIK